MIMLIICWFMLCNCCDIVVYTCVHHVCIRCSYDFLWRFQYVPMRFHKDSIRHWTGIGQAFYNHFDIILISLYIYFISFWIHFDHILISFWLCTLHALCSISCLPVSTHCPVSLLSQAFLVSPFGQSAMAMHPPPPPPPPGSINKCRLCFGLLEIRDSKCCPEYPSDHCFHTWCYDSALRHLDLYLSCIYLYFNYILIIFYIFILHISIIFHHVSFNFHSYFNVFSCIFKLFSMFSIFSHNFLIIFSHFSWDDIEMILRISIEYPENILRWSYDIPMMILRWFRNMFMISIWISYEYIMIILWIYMNIIWFPCDFYVILCIPIVSHIILYLSIIYLLFIPMSSQCHHSDTIVSSNDIHLISNAFQCHSIQCHPRCLAVSLQEPAVQGSGQSVACWQFHAISI